MRASIVLAGLEASCLLGGPLSILASFYNWNWFFEQRNVRFVVNLIGRTKARFFYALIGLLLSLFALIGAPLLVFGYIVLWDDIMP
ncbi:immunity 17 family protein [Leptolyngbya sp. NIES-2104]|uniref:immunity 17 family protein n=1 Tax=Leptolyngbya sp. NIES-2104 TaxID=1552121 RepID=UPI0006ECB281|nr:immunity 17 family protein [Leptolyngbya sp. NIES-2104]GAP99025.1 hypothetical protein NIES2104_55820 [Leptolyngbya sp. NIES-2104]